MHEKFCESFREGAVEKINFLKNKFFFFKKKVFNKGQHESYENTKICYNCQEKLKNMKKMKSIAKLATIITMQVNIEVLHIAYVF